MGGSREEDRLGRITWDAGNAAGGILAVQLVDDGIWSRDEGGREEGEVRFSEWGGVITCQQ